MKRFFILRFLILSFFTLGVFSCFLQNENIREAVAKPLAEKKKSEKENNTDSIRRRLIRVLDIRKYSGESYTRIAIDLEREVKFKEYRLKNPDRVYVDLYEAYLSPSLKSKFISVEDGILKRIRMGYFEPTTVRIVMDLESLESFSVFSLKSPDRIVIDLFGKDEVVGKIEFNGITKQKVHPLSLPEQLGLKVKRVVIDPGHGGKDTGAIGRNGLTEKEVVLDVAKNLKKIIEENLHWEVILTRDRDVFIRLEDRIAVANAKKADLFISIHANASRRREARGIETYFLNFSSSPDAMEVAARENAISTKNISDLQKILKDLMLNSKINESSKLAGVVQKNIVEAVNGNFSGTKDLGVKQAPFYVLIGAKMPSILVEVSFITNPEEEILLSKEDYRNKITEGIFAGVKAYAQGLMRSL